MTEPLLERDTLALLAEALETLESGFAGLPGMADAGAPLPRADPAGLRAVLAETAQRLTDNYPYPHPLYAGQMLKPPHPVARLAYALAMYINPNNHALDGGRASSAMEKEAVVALAAMCGWETHLGHLTGGGTMANLEALWVARELARDDRGSRRDQGDRGGRILAAETAHYTHARVAGVLGVEFEAVAVDARGRMSLPALESLARRGEVAAVVATLGTTGLGAVDPLAEILELARRHDFRVHVDAAYGGYFTLADNLAPDARRAFDALPGADSIVIDPHKHGLQPYGCGCVLFRDPEVGRIYRHDSPYTYFTSDELHLGEISLECSRAGAAAVALWATQRLLPMQPGGELARGLSSSRSAALELHGRLARDPRYLVPATPELDIVVWAPAGESAAVISARSRCHFDAAAARGLHLALLELPAAIAREHWPEIAMDRDSVLCLRSCLMKPEHEAWVDTIAAMLDETLPD